jgi:hypothetical protein
VIRFQAAQMRGEKPTAFAAPQFTEPAGAGWGTRMMAQLRRVK